VGKRSCPPLNNDPNRWWALRRCAFAHPTTKVMEQSHAHALFRAAPALLLRHRAAEIGVAFEAKPMSFSKNDMRSPNFALNPEGKVPTPRRRRRPLTEARDLFYLARRFPTPDCST